MTRTAIVTGASRGIGAATARLLAEQGWDLCVGYRSDADAAARVVEACRGVGRRAVMVPVDTSVEKQVLELFDRTDDELGAIGGLVNNAGIVAPPNRVDEMDCARVERMMMVNVVGPFMCAREGVRRMSSRHGGSGGVIVNLSSGAVRSTGAGEYVDYAASKAAIDVMTLGLAREVADEAVRVNAVRPGIVDTAIHASGGRPNRVAEMQDTLPMRRAAQPEEVAEAIAWLCSARASYVTGAILDVTGGR